VRLLNLENVFNRSRVMLTFEFGIMLQCLSKCSAHERETIELNRIRFKHRTRFYQILRITRLIQRFQQFAILALLSHFTSFCFMFIFVFYSPIASFEYLHNAQRVNLESYE